MYAQVPRFSLALLIVRVQQLLAINASSLLDALGVLVIRSALMLQQVLAIMHFRVPYVMLQLIAILAFHLVEIAFGVRILKTANQLERIA